MFNTFALLDLSAPDLLIVFAIILLLFGSKKLPELAKSLGTSARELKAGIGEASEAGRELKQQVAKVAAVPQPAFVEAGQPEGQLAPVALAPQASPQPFRSRSRRTLIQ